MSIGVLITSEEHLHYIDDVLNILEALGDHPDAIKNLQLNNHTLNDAVIKDIVTPLIEWFDSIKYILTQLPSHSVEDSSYIDSLVS
jgi:hypothetical protein